MKYKTDAYTDIGVKKKTNQDALIVKKAQIKNGLKVCLACICDGMGGLSCGEIASSAFIYRMDEWFKNELPSIFSRTDYTEQLDIETSVNSIYIRQIERSWNNLIQEMNVKLMDYGQKHNFQLGTTVVAILMVNEEYIAMNVGDSRAYLVKGKKVDLITHDHSYVQQQIDEGNMTIEEARISDKKSLLLQCVGASKVVTPEFYYGTCRKNEIFLLASDGFWRRLELSEIAKMITRKEGLKELTERVKERGETDNISSLFVLV